MEKQNHDTNYSNPPPATQKWQGVGESTPVYLSVYPATILDRLDHTAGSFRVSKICSYDKAVFHYLKKKTKSHKKASLLKSSHLFF